MTRHPSPDSLPPGAFPERSPGYGGRPARPGATAALRGGRGRDRDSGDRSGRGLRADSRHPWQQAAAPGRDRRIRRLVRRPGSAPIRGGAARPTGGVRVQRARLVRGGSGPEAPDIEGFALRVWDAGGTDSCADILFASTGSVRSGGTCSRSGRRAARARRPRSFRSGPRGTPATAPTRPGGRHRTAVAPDPSASTPLRTSCPGPGSKRRSRRGATPRTCCPGSAGRRRDGSRRRARVADGGPSTGRRVSGKTPPRP